MLAREEKYIHDWETKRSKGKWNYIFLTTLLWGTLLSVLVIAFKLAINGLLSFDRLLNKVFDITFLPTWIKFVAGAFVFALLMWYLALKKYRELKRKQATQRELRLPH